MASSSDAFGPASKFGVPLSPFLPGAPWGSIRELLHEAMSDLNRGWVMDYLLRPNPLFAANILSSPTQISKALSLSAQIRVLSCGANNNTAMASHMCYHDTLLVPAYSVDDIGLGIGIEGCYGPGPPDVYFSSDEKLIYFIVNNRTGTSISVIHGEQVVDLSYNQLLPSGKNKFVNLLFEKQEFLEAFKNRSKICFDKLVNSLIRSSHCAHDSATAQYVVDNVYPYLITLPNGDMKMKGVVSEHRGLKILGAMPVFAEWNTIRGGGSKANTPDFLKKWGLSYIFSKTVPVPQRSPSSGPATKSLTHPLSQEEDEHPIDHVLQGCESASIDQRPQIHSIESTPRIPAPSDPSDLNARTISTTIAPLQATIPFAAPLPDCAWSGNEQTNILACANRMGRKEITTACLPRAAIGPIPRTNGISSNRNISKPRKIAPDQSRRTPPKSSTVPSAEAEKQRKILQRKIRKREAAARSHAKRKALTAQLCADQTD